MKNRIQLHALILLLCTFVGCSRSSYHILVGSFQWENGSYDDAVASYLSAGDAARVENNTYHEQYAQCGLAACYYVRNENDAAKEIIHQLQTSNNSDTSAFAWYTAGLIAYRAQEYDHAATCFQKSLEYDNNVLDARINLELSLQAHEQATARQKTATAAGQDGEPLRQDDPLTNAIRNKEVDQWKNAFQDSDPTSQDY